MHQKAEPRENQRFGSQGSHRLWYESDMMS
jgi:hypothetical protein